MQAEVPILRTGKMQHSLHARPLIAHYAPFKQSVHTIDGDPCSEGATFSCEAPDQTVYLLRQNFLFSYYFSPSKGLRSGSLLSLELLSVFVRLETNFRFCEDSIAVDRNPFPSVAQDSGSPKTADALQGKSIPNCIFNPLKLYDIISLPEFSPRPPGLVRRNFSHFATTSLSLSRWKINAGKAPLSRYLQLFSGFVTNIFTEKSAVLPSGHFSSYELPHPGR